MMVDADRAPFSCFVDRTLQPDITAVRRALANARTAWEYLEAHLAGRYGLRGSLHFMYGKRYGWALRFERGGRLALALYPNRGHLTVQIVLGNADVAAARDMTLAPSVERVLHQATEYPEGRWLFVPVTTPRGARDLEPLIALKLSRRVAGPAPRKRARSRATDHA